MDALERGAPDEEIKALMDKLRQAMQRYMQQMAQNAAASSRTDGPNAARRAHDVSQKRSRSDLLKKIEDLAKHRAIATPPARCWPV